MKKATGNAEHMLNSFNHTFDEAESIYVKRVNAASDKLGKVAITVSFTIDISIKATCAMTIIKVIEMGDLFV